MGYMLVILVMVFDTGVWLLGSMALLVDLLKHLGGG